MIKAIIFDFGNVLMSFDTSIFISAIRPYSPHPAENIYNIIYDSGLEWDFERGSISAGEFIERVISSCSLSISEDKVASEFCRIFSEVPGMLQIVKSLKGRYLLGLLSNTNPLHYSSAIQPHPAFPLFDAVTLSFEVKAMKPSKDIFMDISGRLGQKPSECLYIDDIKGYADAASELGFKSIHFTGADELYSALLETKIL